MSEVREVWSYNLEEEMEMMSRQQESSRYVAIDAEFPGFLFSTPRWASEVERYRDLKHNVDSLKVIQLGVTLFHETSTTEHRTWQFNLRDFDLAVDRHSVPSIELLKKSGIDFGRLRGDGVEARALSDLLRESLFVSRGGRTRWITFHGLYDVAYLLKLIRQQAPLPDTLDGFVDAVHEEIGDVHDMKHMMRFCCQPRLSETGLVRLSKTLGVDWEGKNHLAGHDSLLTAAVFLQMRRMYFRCPKDQEEEHAGVLYSVEMHCLKRKRREREREMAARRAWPPCFRVPPHHFPPMAYTRVVVPVVPIVFPPYIVF